MQNLWSSVDRYILDLFEAPDPALEAALRASDEAFLPSIHVSACQGKLLHLLARAIGARAILEIGTLGGYSTIWLARALPAGGRLITLEVDPHHAEVARENLARAGLDGIVELRLGRALDTLPQVEADGCGPFDLTFIDADKEGNADYFDWAIRLSRPGGLIIVDNVVRRGALIDAASDDPKVQGSRRCLERMAAEPRVSATVLQTVGAKGHDGFAIALVNQAEPPRHES